MTDEERDTCIRMLMGTLLANVEPDETTRPINRLRLQFRKGLRRLYKRDSKYYDRMSTEADDVWNQVKDELNDKDYTVNLNIALSILEGLLTDRLWFTSKTFEKAMNSMYEAGKHEPSLDVEKDSNRLIDLFADKLGIKKDNHLSLLKSKIYNNLVLEGKIK